MSCIPNYNFDPEKTVDNIVEFLRSWYEINGKNADIVIGISGGKDSSVVAALCVKAFGKEKIIGVLMPDGEQSDISYSYDLCKELDIRYVKIDIHSTFNALRHVVNEELCKVIPGIFRYAWGDSAEINAPARIRMVTLYAVAQSLPNGGRVMNTCNLSEDYIGYATRWGDSVGDVAPISMLTVTEVKQIGKVLGLPDKFIDKAPSDGLCGLTDEDRLGFTYDELDKYIRSGIEPEEDKLKKITDLHKNNKFKMVDIPRFNPGIDIYPYHSSSMDIWKI